MENNTMPESLFAQLTIMLATSAMQQLGLIPHPVSGKREVHLQEAQSTIDILDMLAAKTQGNLTDEENKVLGDVLQSVRMQYVQVAQNGAPPQPPADEAAPKPPPQPEQPQPSSENESNQDDKRRFHKTYE